MIHKWSCFHHRLLFLSLLVDDSYDVECTAIVSVLVTYQELIVLVVTI
jgi:hypothetical protein